MELDRYLIQMENQARAIQSLAEDISSEQARWKPEPESWSILEVINHLYDEEREDFRVKLDIILHDPAKPWPPIDPQGWVNERRYNEREIRDSLSDFLDEREKSLKWLRELGSIKFDSTCEAPWGGKISSGDMFAAWVAHDLLHMRQLIELCYAYTVKSVDPYSVLYAGEW